MNTLANNKTIKSIAIVGAGMTGWTVAAALVKGLHGLGIDIVLVDDPDHREMDAYCESCLPASLSFFQMLGINEQELITATQANYTLANHYHSWAYAGQDYFMPFSEHGFMLNRIEFPQYVFNRHLQGQQVEFEKFSLGAVAARLGKFRPTSTQANSLYSTLSYGVQLNCEEYTQYLAAFSRRAGVKHIQAKIVRALVDPQCGTIAGLQLEQAPDNQYIDADGKIRADLYIDCTGLNGLLVGQALDVAFITAENTLPVNASACFVKPSVQANQVNTRLSPEAHGWLAITHTQKQQQFEYFFQSGSTTGDQIMQALEQHGDISKTLFFRPFNIGQREKFWYQNCVAIGESAFNSGGFVVSKAHLVQSAVLRLLSLFPGSANMPSQQQEFNRLTDLELDHITDFHSLHYYLCGTQRSDFWQAAKTIPLSSRLQHKLSAFTQRGIIPFYEGETFSSGIWTSLLIGSGYWPKRHDPLVNNIDSEWIGQQLIKMQALIGEAANAMPGVNEYLTKFLEKQKIQA